MEPQTGKTLVIGAAGQVGTELTEVLRQKHGIGNVVATDIREVPSLSSRGPFEILDIRDKDRLREICRTYNVKVVYHLAAVLSAKGEQNPAFAWNLNMDSLFNVLDIARELELDRIFWPSSIAVFGPDTPRDKTPQATIANPNTVYGISKLAGERWCEYYHANYGIDVRSLRYPGLIGYKTLPGGGTTDYAVDIFHAALKENKYTCFLSEDAALPMMYMEDAIRATIELMEAPAEQLSVRSSYNVSGCSFSPLEIANEIKKHMPDFTCDFEPDFRQKIAESWPRSIDDSIAAKEWGWKAKYDLSTMTKDMLVQIESLFGKEEAAEQLK